MLRPANIVLDDKLRAKLVDFGLAKFKHGPVEKGIVGTPYYIAPERESRERRRTLGRICTAWALVSTTRLPTGLPFVADHPNRMREDEASC